MALQILMVDVATGRESGGNYFRQNHVTCVLPHNVVVAGTAVLLGFICLSPKIFLLRLRGMGV